mmetsp:Transcript_27018/g.67901  ORF Transcript_27018/g.67901 Transcript_27018/m.67901 type:complete len:124 (-) Transcript_27018:84-455(-)|eukprot:CAMPEP_0177645842 /NCGR_PEP_ID=MMETSP0447-20121125/9462_1 /TAXON_ID=0 /ORGANISM="Stygamoeba regulata, Strain BSH-02190019" /LENGTH=123 /DNA_ID=CAMNT_0019148347 /DNA_START=92 /DNA_END=463 /DNA_ORIENTATION=-
MAKGARSKWRKRQNTAKRNNLVHSERARDLKLRQKLDSNLKRQEINMKAVKQIERANRTSATPVPMKKKLRMVVELMDEATDSELMKPSGGISKSSTQKKKKTAATAVRATRQTRSSTRVVKT